MLAVFVAVLSAAAAAVALGSSMKSLWPFASPSDQGGLLDKVEGVAKQVGEAIYWSGVTHGVLGTLICLIVLWLLWKFWTECDRNTRIACLGVLATILFWYSGRVASPPPAKPAPPVPSPAPAPKPWLPRPWKDGKGREAGATVPVGKVSVGGPVAPDGFTEVACDLPPSERKKNIASPPGSTNGCCVFRSIDHAARWQNLPALYGFPEWMVKNRVPGGGYPEKVDKLVPQIAADRKLPKPNYVNHEGSDLAFLRGALATGRMPCVTYNGHDPHYGNTTIAHMVNLVALTENWAAVLDNNDIGENELVWMTPDEFKQRWTGGKSGWAVVFFAPPPPPPPHP